FPAGGPTLRSPDGAANQVARLRLESPWQSYGRRPDAANQLPVDAAGSLVFALLSRPSLVPSQKGLVARSGGELRHPMYHGSRLAGESSLESPLLAVPTA